MTTIDARVEAADLARGAIMGAATKQLESALLLAQEAQGPEGVVDWLTEELARGGLDVRVCGTGFMVVAR